MLLYVVSLQSLISYFGETMMQTGLLLSYCQWKDKGDDNSHTDVYNEIEELVSNIICAYIHT